MFNIALRIIIFAAWASCFTPSEALAGKFGGRIVQKARKALWKAPGLKRVFPHRLRRSLVKPRKPEVVTADQAMRLVNSGDRVLLPTEVNTSQMLVDALSRRAERLSPKRPLEVLHTASFLKNPSHATSKNIRVNALFINGALRKHVDKISVTPTYLSEIPKLLQTNLKPNVVLVRVSPPDRRGYVNTGMSAGVISELLADPNIKVIAEVNPNVPRTRGATRLHQSHINYMVKSKEPIPELNWGKSSLVDKTIGKHVARNVPSGSTLQLGIGPLQKAVAEQISTRGIRIKKSGKRYELKVRSEMIDDGLVAMAKAGVLSKRRNSIQLGFAVGSKKLYDFLGKDRRVKMVPTRKINDPMEAGKRHKLMAINSAVAVDLYGQACSEMIPRPGADGKNRPVPYSGVGGQVDFFRAVQRSKGGKGFLTMRSTAKNGTISSINLDLSSQLRLVDNKLKSVQTPGLVVTTNRYDVDRVVTEWGVAKLRGKDVVSRAQSLVKIAHPKFRKQLARQGMERFGGDAAAWKKAAHVSAGEWRLAKAFAQETN